MRRTWEVQAIVTDTPGAEWKTITFCGTRRLAREHAKHCNEQHRVHSVSMKPIKYRVKP